MIKRTIEISSLPSYIRVRFDQLEIRQRDGDNEKTSKIPCEDIGLMIVDQHESTYTHAALSKLMDAGATLVVCGRDHLPSGMLLPISEHTEVIWRIDSQISVSKPIRKQLWQQIVQAKIRAQANNLQKATKEYIRLMELAKNVRSGDPGNFEAQAARFYWPVWLPGEKPFRRNSDGKDKINILLNYGYSIVRASVARAIVSAGLLPHFGLHHSNRSNAFCLADDLMEPFRPMVDYKVRKLALDGNPQLNRDTKAVLLETLTDTVQIKEQCGPLMVALHRMIASLVRCYDGEDKQLLIPEVIKSK